MLVGEHGEGGDGLVESCVRDAHGVVARLVVQLDHDAVALTVVYGDRVDELRLDVVAVDRIDPHWVLVDGDSQGFHARAADPVDAGPFVLGVDVDGFVTGATVRDGADILEIRGN